MKNNRWKINAIIKKSTSLFSFVVLIIFSLAQPSIHAAQFIDSLPTDLQGNWTVCSFLSDKLNSNPKATNKSTCNLSDSLDILLAEDISFDETNNQVNQKSKSISPASVSDYQNLIGKNYSTYSKQFIVNGELQKKTLAIYAESIDEADEIRLNGYLIGKTGNFPPFFQGAFRQSRLYVIPAYALKFNQFNHIEIKSFNSINKPGLNGIVRAVWV